MENRFVLKLELSGLRSNTCDNATVVMCVRLHALQFQEMYIELELIKGDYWIIGTSNSVIRISDSKQQVVLSHS